MDKSQLEHLKLEADLNRSLLDSKKLDRDLETYTERFEIEKKKIYSERNRFWAESFRFLAVIIITSITTYFTNNYLEDHKNNNAVIFDDYKSFKADQEKFNDPVTGYSAKTRLACKMLDDYSELDIKRVKKFLRRIAAICGDTSIQAKEVIIRKDVQNSAVSESLKKKLESVEMKKNELQEKLKSASSAERARLNASAATNQHTIDSITNLPQIKTLSMQSEAVTKSFNEQAKAVNDVVKESSTRKIEDGYPQTRWFKPNYFLVIDNMKIVLEDILNDGSIRISMCRSVTSEVCPIEKKFDLSEYNDKITFDKPIEKYENGYKYIIRLDHIGSAGFNPFTKAAYVTIEKYKD